MAASALELGAAFTAGDVPSVDLFALATQAASDRGGIAYALATINLKPLAGLTGTDVERDFRINAPGAAKAAQADLPTLKAGTKPSSVVLFSIVAVANGFASQASILMAKGAVEGPMRALAAHCNLRFLLCPVVCT